MLIPSFFEYRYSDMPCSLPVFNSYAERTHHPLGPPFLVKMGEDIFREKSHLRCRDMVALLPCPPPIRVSSNTTASPRFGCDVPTPKKESIAKLLAVAAAIA